MMEDTVSIKPFASETSGRAVTYGTAVVYTAQVLPFVRKVRDARGEEFVSMARIIISGRVAFDPRDEITLPAGFSPNVVHPKRINPYKGLGLDSTEIIV